MIRFMRMAVMMAALVCCTAVRATAIYQRVVELDELNDNDEYIFVAVMDDNKAKVVRDIASGNTPLFYDATIDGELLTVDESSNAMFAVTTSVNDRDQRCVAKLEKNSDHWCIHFNYFQHDYYYMTLFSNATNITLTSTKAPNAQKWIAEKIDEGVTFKSYLRTGYYMQYSNGSLTASTTPTQHILVYRKIAVKFDMSNYGLGTLYYSNKNMTLPNGLWAFTYKVADSGELQLTHTYAPGDAVPKDVGVVVAGTPGETYILPLSDADGTETRYDNDLRGIDRGGQPERDTKYYFYKLTTKAGTTTDFGFYWGSSAGETINFETGHRAYLKVLKTIVDNSTSANGFSLDGAVPASVDAIDAAAHTDATLYDLTGRAVVHPTRGLYIVNGRKMVVR